MKGGAQGVYKKSKEGLDKGLIRHCLDPVFRRQCGDELQKYENDEVKMFTSDHMWHQMHVTNV